jgi:hypothetical protein
MSEFSLHYYQTEASRLALEIERKLVILGVDWHSPRDMQSLAQRVLETDAKRISHVSGNSHHEIAWIELCGLIGLMNTLMAGSAEKNVEVHGNEAWKAVSQALWKEKGV